MKITYWVLTTPKNNKYTKEDIYNALRKIYNDSLIDNYEFENQYHNTKYGIEEQITIESNEVVDFFNILELYMNEDLLNDH